MACPKVKVVAPQSISPKNLPKIKVRGGGVKNVTEPENWRSPIHYVPKDFTIIKIFLKSEALKALYSFTFVHRECFDNKPPDLRSVPL